ncbi:MAG: sulfotransferase domain-containing protein [Flavobacteriales bacterium]|nr:sulfotransferase domain-containing protein [Flavobacteriales bacterium]MCW8912402.1 sulfotransferase domain-containing protein [Flavobacteriales bacterium]MCW8936486.1 sulfotransferase domain-containing protein [Flavobacteriales bacterium]MCW8967552.1 sulfotransferase domain-containing protein [Flavobacteriales bacterium]MCW8989541.1 sulfotransferase domain-containing protein [Flavobacteriales bacterium]
MNTTPKIDLMIVGAQKAGTTSLNNYLNEHPEIIGHATLQKEFAYFRDNNIFSNGYEKAFQSAFTIPSGNDNRKKIVAKNAAIYNNETAIKHLYEHNPEGKVIFILREPVSRTYSSYAMEVFKGWMDRDFVEIKSVVGNNNMEDDMYKFFIEPSLYIHHIDIIFKYFTNNQVKLFLFEDFKTNPGIICKEIFEWLEVDANFSPTIQKTHNETKKAKSKIVSKLIYNLKQESNLIKKIAKKVLPYSIFSRLGETIVESNKSTQSAEKISEDMSLLLQKYFKPYNEELAIKTKLPIDKFWKY